MKATVGKLAAKDMELKTAKVDLDKAYLDKARANLKTANELNNNNHLFFANKETELQKVKEELQAAINQEADIVAEYRKSMDFVTRLANQYNGGWSAVMRCARHDIPDIKWGKVEYGHGRQGFELLIDGEILDIGVTKADSANAYPCFEFEEEDQDAANKETVNDVQETDVVILDGPESKEVAASIVEEPKVPDTEAKPAGVLKFDKAAANKAA